MNNIPQSDFNATIDSVPMGVYPSGVYHWETCEKFFDGQVLNVVFSHNNWGTKEFDIVIADPPDTFIYSPDLDLWISRIKDSDPNNDSLRVSWPPTNYCNNFWGWLTIFGGLGAIHIDGELQGNSLFYPNAGNNTNWQTLKDSILNKGGFSILNTAEWRTDIKWNNLASIRAYCTAIQTGISKKIPVQVPGVYDLTANYTAYNGGSSVTVTNETDVFTINQSGSILSIPGKPGVTGTVDGNAISLIGDILPGDGSGGNQTISGTATGNSIQGTISGTVMVQFPGTGQPTLSNISSGSFTLVKRN